MSPELLRFVRAHYAPNPAASVPVKEFAAAFKASLPLEAASNWPRGRIVSELSAAGYALGLVAKVLHIAGIAPRQAALRVVDGELVASHV